MAGKDYYQILGVSKDESASGIRDAFRKLAKKYHPDKAGPERTAQFQDIMEAYEVLSDPQKRSTYDRQLRQRNRGYHWRRETPIYDSAYAQEERFCNFFSRRSSFGPRSGRVYHRYRASHPQPDLILVLSQSEARKGGTVTVEVPFYEPCPRCGGTGEEGFFPCMACFGEGLLRKRKKLEIAVPVNVEDGTVLEVPLQRIGTLMLYLTVLVEVRQASG